MLMAHWLWRCAEGYRGDGGLQGRWQLGSLPVPLPLRFSLPPVGGVCNSYLWLAGDVVSGKPVGALATSGSVVSLSQLWRAAFSCHLDLRVRHHDNDCVMMITMSRCGRVVPVCRGVQSVLFSVWPERKQGSVLLGCSQHCASYLRNVSHMYTF